MSELEMKTEAEEFTDELSDEALDRADGGYMTGGGGCACTNAPPRS